MKTKHNSIDYFLGTPDSRYFGDGFRTFCFDINVLSVSDHEISGLIHSQYLGGNRPRNEEVHLGSVEFLALAMRLGTYGLNRLGKLGIADTNRAFLSHYNLKAKKVLKISAIAFYCRMCSSNAEIDSLQGSRSLFEINIGGNIAVLELDHCGGTRFGSLPDWETIAYDRPQLHCTGYKQSTLTIQEIEVDLENLHITAVVLHKHPRSSEPLDGVGSASMALLGTDAVRVFGQLMQVLLYTTEGTDRIRCPNIWLRKMELRSERPLLEHSVQASVRFHRIRKIKYKGECWQLIELSGIVGNFIGNFEVGIMR